LHELAGKLIVPSATDESEKSNGVRLEVAQENFDPLHMTLTTEPLLEVIIEQVTFEEKQSNVADRAGWVLARLTQLPRDWKLLPLLTLAMLATATNANLYVPLLVIAIAVPRLQVDPTFWLVAAMPQAAAALLRWGQLDNHQYLIMYWCLVLCLGYGAATRDRKRIIAFNARALIALCMGFAVLAKLVSPSYINGAFFQHTLLLDPRFAVVSEHVAGMTEEQLNTNQKTRESLHTTRSKSEMVPRTQLELPRQFR
jgi:hypothetical protein